jgi:hypothetical protein
MTFVLSEGIKEKEVMMELPPFGPGFTNKETLNAETMDIVATDLNEPGPDYALFILRNKEGNIINSKKITGY